IASTIIKPSCIESMASGGSEHEPDLHCPARHLDRRRHLRWAARATRDFAASAGLGGCDNELLLYSPRRLHSSADSRAVCLCPATRHAQLDKPTLPTC